MTHPLHRFAYCALLLALPAHAQDAPKQTNKLSQGSPLVIRTSDPKVAERSAHGLGCDGELPEAKEGSYWEISLDDGGKAKVATRSGPVGYMEILARPGPLLEIFADQADEALAGMRAALVLAFTAQGLKAKDAAKMAQGFVDFPKQIATVEVKLSGNPDRMRKQGLDVGIALVPVAGTGFADFAASLRPNGQGAPRIGGEGMMSASFSIEAGDFGKLAMSFLDFAATVSGKSGEDAKKFTNATSRALGWVDGSMAMTWGEDGMRVVVGLSNPKAYAEFLESEEGKALMKTGSSQYDVDVQSKALEHHGVAVTKSTLTPKENADPPPPVLGKGPINTYMAIAGNWLVMSMLGTKDAAIKDLIDRATEQRTDQKPHGEFARAPLPDGALLTMSVDLAKMAGLLAGQEFPPDAPQQMNLAIKKTLTGIGLAIHLK